MKKLLATIVYGFILLFFIHTAFKIDGLTQEMLINYSVRFFLGFLLLLAWGWSKQKRKYKVFLYSFIIFIISDAIFDYEQDILDLEMMLHDLFFFFWGAISGYFFVNYLHYKKTINSSNFKY
jgi:signal transduction histidine kinase